MGKGLQLNLVYLQGLRHSSHYLKLLPDNMHDRLLNSDWLRAEQFKCTTSFIIFPEFGEIMTSN